MSEPERDYAAIRRNVEQGVARQKWNYRILFFGTHLLFYVVAMLVMWGTVLSNPDLQSLFFDSESSAGTIIILPTILWTMVIFFHAAALYIESGVGERALRERFIMREVGKEILRKGLEDDEMAEKPKRYTESSEAEAMRLSDDGELIPIDEDKRHLRI